ncbi:MAG: porin [Burkholderiaceae bacterium]
MATSLDHTMPTPLKTICAALVLMGFVAPSYAATEGEISAAVSTQLDRMQREIENLRAEVQRMKDEKLAQPAAARASTQQAAPDAAAAAANASAPPPSGSAYASLTAPDARTASAEPATTLSGYGEINYTRPRNNAGEAQLDVRRAVLGLAHRFTDKTRLNMELEVEHAVASRGDSGEVALEQLYIAHQLTPEVGLQAGLFLIPAGLINRNHEPTAYYGVERNFVETAIIPSTWREVGVGIVGTPAGGFARGLEWNIGATSGFDLNKWDSTSTDGRESPLGSIHQEGQKARARNLWNYVALDYKGIPSLLVGGSVFSGRVGHGQPDFAARNARMTLWDGHVRWTPGRWDLSAIYAKGMITGARDLNLSFAGNPTPVPREFFGWYVQSAYTVWSNGESSVSPFARYERFNTASKIDDLPPGLGFDPTPTERVATVGLSYRLYPSVVFKADYQKFKVDPSRDRYNVGLGYAF